MKKNYLFLAFIIFIVSQAGAQDTEIGVSSRISPSILTVDTPFTLTLFIEHPAPEAVNIIAPPFTGSLTLDRYIKSSRVTQAGPVTAAEFRIIANTTGRFSISSFTIITPLGIIETGGFVFDIHSPGSDRIIIPRLTWEGAPQSGVLTVGERVTIILRANDWNEQMPAHGFFVPEVPRGVILSASAVSSEERADGIVMKLTLIPMAAGNFSLPARVLNYGNTRFEIPALRIRIIDRERNP